MALIRGPEVECQHMRQWRTDMGWLPCADRTCPGAEGQTELGPLTMYVGDAASGPVPADAPLRSTVFERSWIPWRGSEHLLWLEVP